MPPNVTLSKLCTMPMQATELDALGAGVGALAACAGAASGNNATAAMNPNVRMNDRFPSRGAGPALGSRRYASNARVGKSPAMMPCVECPSHFSSTVA